MNILQMCQRYFPTISMVEEHVRSVSERLAREHQLILFAADPSGALPKGERVKDVLVGRFNNFSPSGAYHVSFEILREFTP